MKVAFLLAWSLLISSAPAGALEPPADAKGLEPLSFKAVGLKREVWLGKPSGRGPWPLVLALHGGGGTALGMARLSHLTDLAKEQGFLVAYPDSGVKAWDDGRRDFKDAGTGHDDSGWLAALAQHLVEQGLADRHRLYVCGMSNGGFMTERLACDHPELFAAAGVVAATKVATYASPPGVSIPLCFIMGTKDPLVPFNGGNIRVTPLGRSRGKVLSLAEALDFWKARDHASPAGDSVDLPDLDPGDGTLVKRSSFKALSGGAELQVYVVDGGGHAWPGGWQYLRPWLIGKTSRDLDASQALWDFFKDKRR